MSTAKAITILDGGMSRELIRIGAPFRQPEWSALALIEAPEYVRRVHEEFIDAGAQVITTNSYALVPFHIGEDRFQQQGAHLAALAGQQAKAAADCFRASTGRSVLVAGSLPPIFGSYEPDKFDPDRVHAYLRVLVEAMAPYVDIWLGETLSLIAEAQAVQEAVRGTGKPLWVAFTVDDTRTDNQPNLRSGEAVSKAVQWAVQSHAEAILFNCSNPEVMDPAIRVARQVVLTGQESGRTLAVGAYANGFSTAPREGPANESCGTLRHDLDPPAYASFVRSWVESGATIVGGCCGIGRDHIGLLASEFKTAV